MTDEQKTVLDIYAKIANIDKGLVEAITELKHGREQTQELKEIISYHKEELQQTISILKNRVESLEHFKTKAIFFGSILLLLIKFIEPIFKGITSVYK